MSTTRSPGCAASPTIPIRFAGSERTGRARSHEAAAAGNQLWNGRAVPGERSRSPPTGRQRDHRAPQAPLSAILAMACRTRCSPRCCDRRIETVFGWPLRLSSSPNKRTLYNFPMQAGGAEMLRLAAGGCATPASCRHADPRRHAIRGARPRADRSRRSRSCAPPAATSATASRSVSTSIRY